MQTLAPSFSRLAAAALALALLLLLDLALAPPRPPPAAYPPHRVRGAGRAAPSPPPAGVLRVALLGDSITLGKKCYAGSYGDRLIPALGARHYALRVFADDGKTATRLDPATGKPIRFGPVVMPFTDTPLWADARAYDAEVYVCMLGTNDASTWWREEAYVADYAALVGALQGQPAAPVVFLAVPPPAFGAGEGSMPLNFSVINSVLPARAVAAVAAAAGGAPVVVDVFSALGGAAMDGGGLFCDGLHPRSPGTDRIAAAVYRALWAELVVRRGWPPFEGGEGFFDAL